MIAVEQTRHRCKWAVMRAGGKMLLQHEESRRILGTRMRHLRCEKQERAGERRVGVHEAQVVLTWKNPEREGGASRQGQRSGS